MTDAVFALIVLVSFVAGLALVRYFRTLEGDFGRAATTPVMAGIVVGILLALPMPVARFLAAGVLLTLASLYVRLTGRESEPVDGMLMGALTGAVATIPLLFTRDDVTIALAECVLAGAVAGYGITFAVLHVADKVKQLLLDVVTAAAAVGAAAMPSFIRLPDRRIATIVAVGVPLLAAITVFVSSGDVRRELADEARLGFIDDTDVRRTADPLLRLGRSGWTDAGAHREFVRLANRIALRKRQQRRRPDEIARLYQLEIIKLRMQIQEMSRIDRALRLRATAGDAHAPREEEVPSDTMANR